MINQNFLLIGVLLQLLTGVGYVIETIQGKVKPNKVSWFLWTLAPMIAFSAEIHERVGLQSLLTFIIGFVPLLVFIASFINKKSYWKISKFDIICGSLSILGLVLWLITKQGNIAIIFSMIADLFASLPTIVKSYQEPETESVSVFAAGIVLGILTLLTIKHWTIAEAAFPIYVTFDDSLIAFLIKTKIGKKLAKS